MSKGERSAASLGISVVVPVFNEVVLLDELRERLTATLEQLGNDFEVILVDDGSADGTTEAADRMNAEDSRFRCIHLSRNFGHQAAVTAGLQFASNELVFVMDGDLQDPPEVLPLLIGEWESGSDVVYGFRGNRKEHWLLVTLYHLFYRILALLSTVAIPLDAGDFCLMSRRVVDEINRLPEKERFIRGLRTWVGFKQSGLTYDRAGRAGGRSKYSLTDLFRLAISGIVSFSDKPLIYVMVFGLLTSAAAFLYGAWLVVYTLVFGGIITGYASLMAGMLFLGGIQLTSIGIVGIYISTVFREVKSRPTYIVSSLCGLTEKHVVQNGEWPR